MDEEAISSQKYDLKIGSKFADIFNGHSFIDNQKHFPIIDLN